MKKIMITLLSVSSALSFATAVWAGPFEHFYDYQNPDGTYAYYLEAGERMQSVFVTLDKDWYRHTRVLLEDGGASFYHRDSYNAYAEEGMKGGWLFTIGACVNSDFQDLPSFEYIGFDDENAMNYYAELPTDYQAYMEDEFILTILGSLAENESLSISENEKWSVRRRFQKGTYRQAVAPYGYRLEDGKLIPDKGTAPVVQFIFSEACRGDGAHRIAKELNGRGIPAPKSGLWKSCTVDEILRNERYTGDAVFQKTFTDSSFARHKNKGECGKFLHRNHHEAIISREQYEKVQMQLRTVNR